MAKSNFIVRGGADFSGIKKEMQKTQQQMNSFQASVSKGMSGIGRAIKLALGYVSVRAISDFVKSTIKAGSDVAEIQNVVNVTFGAMTKDIEEFSKTAMTNFGLGELSAKKYASTMGAMLKSSGVTGEQMKEMSVDLTKLTADMASFHNLENDEVFRKIMSGMSGMSRPLKDLGINMNVANLEAFAMSQGIQKSYQHMTQAEQAILRYNYLLSVTGDMQGDFSRNSHNWAHQLKILSEQWNNLKATLGQGFINILAPIIRGFNVLIQRIQVAAEYFRAFTVLVFGNTQASRKTADNLGYLGGAAGGLGDQLGDVNKGLGGASKGLGKAGKAAKKAGKEMQGAIMGFDEIHQLAEKTAEATSGAGGGGAGGVGGVGGVDFGMAQPGEVDLGFGKAEEDLKRLSDAFKRFYEDWGMKDIFDGIRAGAALVNFDNIKRNLKTAFSGWADIARTAGEGLQPIAKATGEMFGTLFKYGIAITGNVFEPITEGFANFTINMKDSIQEWIMETSETITSGFNNLTNVFEILGQSWLESIIEYQPIISDETENTFTNIAETMMLIGTVVSDTFEIITGRLKEFIEENKLDIQTFMESILGIFTDIWGFINDVWHDTLDELKEFWDEWGGGIIDSVMDVVTDIGEWFLYLWNDLVKPVWDRMVNWLKEIWDESLRDIVHELLEFVGKVGELIGAVWNVISPIINKLLHVLVPAFKNAFYFILDYVGSVVKGIADIIKGLIKALGGITDFLIGVFTGDWRRAWEGVKRIFEGIANAIGAMFKIPINVIISSINMFLRGLNRIKIPDFVPGIGGKGFNIPEIPRLYKGGITDGPMIAMVGDNPGGKEVISPLDTLQDMLVSAVGTALLQTNQTTSATETEKQETYMIMDGEKFAKLLIPKLMKEFKRIGVEVQMT